MSAHPLRSRLLRAAVAGIATGAVVLTAPFLSARPASASVLVANDYCLDQCNDILPPGENGNATLADILAHQALGTRPAHSADQLDAYANLLNSYTGLTDEQIGQFYNDSSFGVPAGQVESTESPRSDVTIVRDKATGVPHVTGTTRAGTMYGAGYAGAEDRLFVMDLLRHVGRGTLTSFAGGSPGNQALEQSVWRNSPYTEADLAAQVDTLRAEGARGAQLYTDMTDYLAGINGYIAHCMSARPVNCPGEYVLTGHLDAITNAGGPQPFTPTDLIAIAGVVGGLFGGGGGAEMQSALVRVEARAKYGPALGDQVWQAFREQNDPETVLTLHNGQSFPYGQAPAGATGVVLPDRGSASPVPVVTDPSGSAGGGTSSASNGTAPAPAGGVLPGLTIGQTHQGMSNAVVISAADSATGHPIAVFGPQTGYFSPQLLMLEELQGPGISARGAAFAGLNLYVQLGRGQDYAWSATSAEQDMTDTYAVPLCDPSGAATLNSNYYLYHGQCLAMDRLAQSDSWKPTLADETPSGSYTLVTYRTKYGLVSWRGTVNGVPTVFASLRSTYRHEADSAIGFQMFDDPSAMSDAAGFQAAAANVGYAFNWFYVNSTQNAYYDSGLNPVRAGSTDPNLPVVADAAHEWAGWNADSNTATYLPASAHPQSVNQDYYVSWNNKQAKDYSAADGNFSFGPVQRAKLLDDGVKAALAGGHKLSRSDAVKVMEDAANVDLRAKEDLGLLLRVLTSQPTSDPAVAALQQWYAAGAHRIESSPGSHTYQYADAIRIFDAWWPLLVSGEFRSGLGDPLYGSLVNAMQVNESPSGGQQGTASGVPASANESQPHKGSSFQYGWWGYVSKDLRSVLGQAVAGPLTQTYCGGGNLATCRATLLSTVDQAAAQPASQVYPGDDICSAGDQWCADSIVQSPLGGITDSPIGWQNRPTYQQVVSFPAHRGNAIANLAAGRPASASSTQLLTGYTPGKATDGDPTSRWSSNWSDNQWISVDLGSAQSVGRVILRWENAYATGYRVEVSSDGSTWRTVWSTTTGNGGTDNDTFAATTARYVRMTGTARGSSYGYSLYEFEAYPR
ncbi:penicillin acylase [Rugosimonospora africana]|uniref:Penicillin acylase n=1 Tax=Rugosimonospora africana TaxID=556532 RepID=A0A8J3QTM0_9ACTN|nr:penicillin acylase [Rugosimonospora africana]